MRIEKIFAIFLKKQALWPVVAELHRRGWRHKAWTTRASIERGGEPFTTVSVQRLLTNPIYIGKVAYQRELHDGEHPAIIDTATWHKVQAILARRARSGASTARSPSGALLQGLLYCRACGGLMTPTHTSRNDKRYRYYVCRQTWKHPSGKSTTVAAAHIESVVLNHLARQHGSVPILGTLIARIDFDGPRRQVTIHFRDSKAEPIEDICSSKRSFHVAAP